jgi:hypothetical protein
MEHSAFPDEHLWDHFLERHPLSLGDEDAFLEYVTQPDTPAIADLDDLEALYREFQHRPT